MSVLTAQIHIEAPASSGRPLPTTPIPLHNSASTTLTPDSALDIPLSNASSSSSSSSSSLSSGAGQSRPQQLSDLADAMDIARASLNKVLTSWKDWAGKEEPSNTAVNDDDDDGQDQDDEEEEEDE